MANTNPFSLEGKIALVTGASYGIGFAIAKAMADAGATMYLTISSRSWWTRVLLPMRRKASKRCGIQGRRH